MLRAMTKEAGREQATHSEPAVQRENTTQIVIRVVMAEAVAEAVATQVASAMEEAEEGITPQVQTVAEDLWEMAGSALATSNCCHSPVDRAAVPVMSLISFLGMEGLEEVALAP